MKRKDKKNSNVNVQGLIFSGQSLPNFIIAVLR